MIRKRILIADDEEIIRTIVRLTLGDTYQISEAVDGEEAWKKITSADPEFDLLMIDWNMPLLGGRELLERIMVGNPQARVILLTGRPDCPVQPTNRVRLINKPFDNSELLKSVADLLTR